MRNIVWPSDYGPAGAVAPAGEAGIPVQYRGPDERARREGVEGLRLGDLFKQVPEVRTVVGFIARAVGSVPLHVFERKSDTDRERVRSGPVASLIGDPSPGRSRVEWLEALVADLAIFDRAYARKVRGDDGRIVALVRVPPPAVTAVGDGLVAPDAFDVVGGHGVERVEPGELLWIAGNDPEGGWHGAPVLESLRDDLSEARELAIARRDAWRKGPRASAVVSRSEKWPNETARDRFLSGLRSFTGDGTRAGSALLLEDGMTWDTLKPETFRDSQAIEGRGFVRQMVASAFGVPLVLLGDSDGATYATATAQRRVLYTEILGSWFARIAAALNDQVVAELAGPGVFVEFVVEAKLRGAFEEQAQVLSTSVGGPWMTRNEARARMNLPALDEGDALVVPLNVTSGGQASPHDVEGRPPGPDTESAPKGRETAAGGSLRVKSGDGATGEHRGTVEDVLRRHFGRQSTAVLGALRNNDSEWWDGDRWNRELAADLFDAAQDLTATLGPDAAESLGFDPDAFDVPRTVEWLRAVMTRRAVWINDATRDQVQETLDAVPVEGQDEPTPEGVFEEAKTSRTVANAAALAVTVAGFAATEAGRQLAPDRSTKTWVVTSGNPRASHAAMGGETVPVGDAFSNGMQWPGDPVGGVSEVAGCMCAVEISLAD